MEQKINIIKFPCIHGNIDFVWWLVVQIPPLGTSVGYYQEARARHDFSLAWLEQSGSIMKFQWRWICTTQNSLFLFVGDELRWARGARSVPFGVLKSPKRRVRAHAAKTHLFVRKGYRQLSTKETQIISIWHCVCITLHVLLMSKSQLTFHELYLVNRNYYKIPQRGQAKKQCRENQSIF
jgi:hypothetical protein